MSMLRLIDADEFMLISYDQNYIPQWWCKQVTCDYSMEVIH